MTGSPCTCSTCRPCLLLLAPKPPLPRFPRAVIIRHVVMQKIASTCMLGHLLSASPQDDNVGWLPLACCSERNCPGGWICCWESQPINMSTHTYALCSTSCGVLPSPIPLQGQAAIPNGLRADAHTDLGDIDNPHPTLQEDSNDDREEKKQWGSVGQKVKHFPAS